MALNQKQIDFIKNLASYYKLPAAFALGIIDKESAGRALYKVNGKDVPAIRIEGHYFNARLTGDVKAAAVKAGLADAKAGGVKNPTNMASRYAMLDRMIAIGGEQASYESISMGLGQIMGAHWKLLHYTSATDMFDHAQTFEGQVDMMFAFIAKNPKMLKAAQNLDYKTFGKAYNGPKAPASYWNDLRQFTQKWQVALGDAPSAQYKNTNPVLDRIKTLGYGTVMEFQSARGIKVDGIIGPITREQVNLAEAELKKRQQAPLKSAAKIVGGVGAVAAPVVAADNPTSVADAVSAVQPVVGIVQSLAPLGTPVLVMAFIAAVGYAGYRFWKYRNAVA